MALGAGGERSGEKPEGGVNDGHDGLQGAIPDRPAWRSCITAHVDVRAAGALARAGCVVTPGEEEANDGPA